MSAVPTLSPTDAQLAQLPLLSRQELVEHWIKVHGAGPPRGVRRSLLDRSAAYHLQARCFGKLKPSTKRALLAIARDEEETGKGANRPSVEIGTRLVREWKGKTHQVLVKQEGFEWNGELYRSLSAVARSITGAHWSGPRFFGL